MMTACPVKLQRALATANKDKRTSFSAALIKLVQVLNSVGASLACLKSDVYGSGKGSGTTTSG